MEGDASMQDLLNMISTVGFPIVISIIMAYYVRDQGDKNREDIRALNEAHKTEMLSVIEALNNNTLALTQLKDSLIERGIANGNNDN